MEEKIFGSYRKRLLDQKMPHGKKAVLLAATDLFAKQGYNGTPTTQIAESAGVSQATIFKYFKTKQDLLTTILQPMIEELLPLYRDDFLAELEQYDTLPELIHFLVQDRYRFLTANSEVVMILLNEAFTNETIRTMVYKVFNESLPSFFTLLHQKMMSQVRADLDTTTVIRTIIGQLGFYFIQQQLAPNIPTEPNRDLAIIEGEILRAIQK
ncbi:TetR/AcrR family transcriptional regulator [Lactobacillus selangorensis]|nr:TetR/AcrR family transcriptional regulator [Lactobacillus selangorensis]